MMASAMAVSRESISGDNYGIAKRREGGTSIRAWHASAARNMSKYIRKEMHKRRSTMFWHIARIQLISINGNA
jgi:hypothetical protein